MIHGQVVLDLAVVPKKTPVEKMRVTVIPMMIAKKAIYVEMTTVHQRKGFQNMLIAALKVHKVLTKNTMQVVFFHTLCTF